MGLRAVTLGHGYPAVVEAAARADARWAPTSRGPSPLELDCAERFLGLVPGAEMVKFARTARTPRRRPSSSPGRRPAATSSPSAATSRSSRPTTGSSDDDDARRDPAGVRRPDRRLPLQRPRKRRRAVRASIPGRSPAWSSKPATAPRSPRAGFLEGLRDLCHADGRPAHLRRDDHGLPLAPRRRAGPLRRRRRTSRPSARRWPTASRSRRWSASGTSWSAAA